MTFIHIQKPQECGPLLCQIKITRGHFNSKSRGRPPHRSWTTALERTRTLWESQSRWFPISLAQLSWCGEGLSCATLKVVISWVRYLKHVNCSLIRNKTKVDISVTVRQKGLLPADPMSNCSSEVSLTFRWYLSSWMCLSAICKFPYHPPDVDSDALACCSWTTLRLPPCSASGFPHQ